jgi:hypothetical protein
MNGVNECIKGLLLFNPISYGVYEEPRTYIGLGDFYKLDWDPAPPTPPPPSEREGRGVWGGGWGIILKIFC